eukprot:2784624-Rhodomonas_salina.1
MAVLAQALEDMGRILRGPYVALLDDYLCRLDENTAQAGHDQAVIHRNSRLACDLNAHKVVLFRNVGAGSLAGLDQWSATSLLSSMVFLTTRHTFNKKIRANGRILLPETELYEVLAVQRRRLVIYAQTQKQRFLDNMMQTVLQVATSSTGAATNTAEVVDAANRWGKLKGLRCAGRFAVAATRNRAQEEAGTAAEHAFNVDEPSEVADTGMLVSDPPPPSKLCIAPSCFAALLDRVSIAQWCRETGTDA